MDDKMEIKMTTDKIKCKQCLWGFLNPYSTGCAKFKMKPNEILFDNEDCEKFEESGEDEEDD